MTRSKTIFSALLCSVSFIPLSAYASASRVTDWHVAPVLATGKNAAPYCALAANYPDAGIIVTHARNKHGGGTIAFDFRRADFEPREFYGVEVRFGNNVRTFAAEARNKHLLVVEMQRDPALYAALDAGKDLQISVQQGGPDVTLAGNTRLFFQLNYCVQALNDDAPGQLIAQNDHAPAPSFGLQQPAEKPIVLRPPVDAEDLNAARLVMSNTPYPQQPVIVPQPAPAPQKQAPRVAQATTNQDGDASRSNLEAMLKNARQDEKTKPVRQKLSSISSTDDIDPNTVAPVSRNARQSLLFDDPNAVNGYVPPRLGDTENNAGKTAPVPVKKAAMPAPVKAPAPQVAEKPVIAKEKPAPVASTAVMPPKPAIASTSLPEPTVAAKTIPAPSAALMKDKPAAIAKPVMPPVPHDAPVMLAQPPANALPAPLPLPDDADASVSAVANAATLSDAKTEDMVTRMQAFTKKAPPTVISDVNRTVLASDYVKEKEQGIPAPEFKASESKPAPIAAKKVVAPVVEPKAPAVIAWDKPIETKIAAPVEKPVVKAAVAVEEKKPAVTSQAIASVAPRTPIQSTTIFSGTPAPIRNEPVLKAATETAPHHSVSIPAKQEITADVAPPPAIPAPTIPAALSASPIDALADKAPAPVAEPVAEKEPVMMAAPAMPPAIIEETFIDNNVRGPMRPAEDAINVSFADEDSNDVPVANITTPADKKDLAVPADVLQTMRFKAIDFKPPASAALSGWNVSNVTGQGKGNFCVMKNRFVNQQSLFLSRSADGNATLGLDYGIDLLQTNRDYKTNVQLDNLFAEDFIGQASKPNLLIVQMGRKDSFFNALMHAKALHVELDGGASTFDVKEAAPQVAKLNSCTLAQGGQALTQDLQPAAVAVPAPAAVIASTPVAPAAVAPQTSSLASIAAKPAVAPAPVAIATKTPVATPAAASSSFSISTSQINALLQQSHITGSVRSDSQGYRWGSTLHPIQGQMIERRFLAGKADLLEAVMRDIDQAERDCGGEFASEIGTPEQQGNREELVAESSCRIGGQSTVQASLYERLGQVFRVWLQKGPDGERDLLIRQRDSLASALDQDTSLQTAKTGN